MELTPETIQATREWFADNARRCIAGATNGEWHVNNLAHYVEWQNQRIEESLAGKWDRTFTFQQRAWFMQTGECIPLLAQ